MMKIKATIFALFLAIAGISTANATVYFVKPSGGGGDCLTAGTRCDFSALPVLVQGDTVDFGVGLYVLTSSFDVSLKYITLRGPNVGSTGVGRTGYVAAIPIETGTCHAAEACLVGDGVPYVVGIGADYTTIDGLNIVAEPAVGYAGIKILEGDWDYWTITNNIIQHAGQKAPGFTAVHSYGIFGDPQSTSGTVTYTGGEIGANAINSIGGQTSGSDITAGMGIYLAGLEGDKTKCDALNKFQCGVWIHDNEFADLAVGKNILNFTIDVNGKELSTAIKLTQDSDNAQTNNGARVNTNVYLLDNVYMTFTATDSLEVGVHMNLGGSSVEEDNGTAFPGAPGEARAYVVNEGRKATIDELLLADFYKSLYPTVQGPGTDIYYRTKTLARNYSDDDATIVFLDRTVGLIDGGGPNYFPDLYEIEVFAYGESISYKVSKDNTGDIQVRAGAQLLFDGHINESAASAPLPNPYNGVSNLVLHGTEGDDLLTVDFNNGNPVPFGTPGIDFNSVDDGGYDAIALRGDEQLTHETIVMADADGGTIYFEPTLTGTDITPLTSTAFSTTSILFDYLEPIDDVLIVNGMFSVVAPDDEDQEINLINGPFRYGFETFQINAGAVKTFEEINFANKKHVHIFGSDDTGSGKGNDIFTVFTEDGDAPDLLSDVYLYGGNVAGGAPDPDDASDDKFVVRPSADFPIFVSGGSHDSEDLFFLDCANTHATCLPASVATFIGVNGVAYDTHAAITGFEQVSWQDIEDSADPIVGDLDIHKQLVGFAADGAHPGDDIEFTVSVKNVTGAGTLDLTTATGTPVWVTDAIDHRFSLIEQSIVVEAGTVDFTDNRSMLWNINDVSLADGDSLTMTYTVIVNTLITTNDISNWASILNEDTSQDQYVDNGGTTLEHYANVDLDVQDVFGYPLKAAITASLFMETEAGPRYMVGLQGGAKDPAQFGLGAALCRVPDTNQQVGWDGGLGNLWYSCGEGLPNIDGIPLPLVVTDLYQDSAGRIWMTTWGNEGLFYSDDNAQTWTDAALDLTGAMGGAPDGIPDTFAQVYSITEDILGTLFISANNGDIFRSFDRGVTWQKAKQLPMGSADTAFSMEADPTLPGTLYAGTFGDSLYVSTDFGETWNRPDYVGLGSGYIYDIEFDPFSGNLFVGTAQGIYYSADGGDNWGGLNSAFPEPTHPPEVRTITFDENGALFASTWGQGVWSSLDWTAFSLGEFALKESNVISVSVSNGKVFALLEDGSVQSFRYSSSAHSVGVEDEITELPATFALDQNYPNPFNPSTAINFSLPQASDVNLAVFDVIGRQVATLVNGQLAAGRHQVTFNAAGLPSGMYLYRLTTPNGMKTQKMILMK